MENKEQYSSERAREYGKKIAMAFYEKNKGILNPLAHTESGISKEMFDKANPKLLPEHLGDPSLLQREVYISVVKKMIQDEANKDKV